MHSKQWNQVCLLMWIASPFSLTSQWNEQHQYPCLCHLLVPSLLLGTISQEAGPQQEREIKTVRKKMGKHGNWEKGSSDLRSQEKHVFCSLNPLLLAFPPKKGVPGPASAFQKDFGLSKGGWLSPLLRVSWREGNVWCQQRKIPFFWSGNSVAFPVYPVCHFPCSSLSFGARGDLPEPTPSCAPGLQSTLTAKDEQNTLLTLSCWQINSWPAFFNLSSSSGGINIVQVCYFAFRMVFLVCWLK